MKKYEALEEKLSLIQAEEKRLCEETAAKKQQIRDEALAKKKELSRKKNQIIRELSQIKTKKTTKSLIDMGAAISKFIGHVPNDQERTEIIRFLEHLENTEKAFSKLTGIEIGPQVDGGHKLYDAHDIDNLLLPGQKCEVLDDELYNFETISSDALADNRSGRKISTKPQILAWRKEHPDGTQAECKNDTGISLPTVKKWWDSNE